MKVSTVIPDITMATVIVSPSELAYMLKSVEGVPMASNPPTSVGIAGAFPAGALVAAAVVLAVVAGAVGAAMVGEVCVVALVVAVDAGLLWGAGDAAW
ncbi:MAG TPA: hypothetical protein PLA44_11920, partial [Propionibacteriaceae bacterium]|nr:hypothetical protein [Propionibacteriaceae bacterium]